MCSDAAPSYKEKKGDFFFPGVTRRTDDVHRFVLVLPQLSIGKILLNDRVCKKTRLFGMNPNTNSSAGADSRMCRQGIFSI